MNSNNSASTRYHAVLVLIVDTAIKRYPITYQNKQTNNTNKQHKSKTTSSITHHHRNFSTVAKVSWPLWYEYSNKWPSLPPPRPTPHGDCHQTGSAVRLAADTEATLTRSSQRQRGEFMTLLFLQFFFNRVFQLIFSPLTSV